MRSHLTAIQVALALLFAPGLVHGTRAASTNVLVATNAIWRFLADGSDPGPRWAELDFDAAVWLSGPAPLGWGEGTEATLLPAADGPRPFTTYFRHVFAANVLEDHRLKVRFRRDDGCRILVNGVEAHRFNLPAGPLTPATPAVNAIEGSAELSWMSFLASARLLRPGTNVIAAELHQHVNGRGDARFELQLAADPAPAVWIASPTNGARVAPGPVTVTMAATDPDTTTALLYVDGVFKSQAGPPFRFTWNPPAAGRYTLTLQAFTVFGDRLASPAVQVQVGDPGPPRIIRGPYLQLASPTGVVVRWRTDWFTDGAVLYGPHAGQLEGLATDPSVGLDHEVRLTGLVPGTSYTYAVADAGQLLAIGPQYQFRTVPRSPERTRIWAIGDFGTGTAEQRQVYDAFRHRHGSAPDVWLMLGDNAYDSGHDDEYQRGLFDVYGDMLGRTAAWPALGNHDAGAADAQGRLPYLDIFTLPAAGECGGVASGTERYYSFDHGAVHFVCLDSMTSDRSSNGPMARWLRADLEATMADWIIAFWHHPPYTWGTHHSDFEGELIEMRENIVPILEAQGVDLVLTGHSHAYERSMLLRGHFGYSDSFDPDSMALNQGWGREEVDGAYTKPAGGMGLNRGTVYVVCGNSGQGGEFEIPLHPAMRAALTGYGSVVIDVMSNRLDCSYLDSSGGTGDYFSIIKGDSDEDRPPLTWRRGPSGIELTWPTSEPPFYLEHGSPADPATWAPHEGVVERVGRRWRVVEPLPGPDRFWRLKRD